MNITKRNKIIILSLAVLFLLFLFTYTAFFSNVNNDCNCSLDPKQSDVVFSGVGKNGNKYLIKPSNVFLEEFAKNKWYIFVWYPENLTEEGYDLKKEEVVELSHNGIYFGDFIVENYKNGKFGYQMLSTDNKENIVKLCKYYAPLYYEDRSVRVVQDCDNYCKTIEDNFCIIPANSKSVHNMLINNLTPRNVENK